MTDHTQVSNEELESQNAAELPDREALSLLDVTADLDLALDIAAPIDAAVAANANAALPIDAAVAANVGTVGSQAMAVADQDSVVSQSLVGDATANAIQDATVDQADDAAQA